MKTDKSSLNNNCQQYKKRLTDVKIDSAKEKFANESFQQNLKVQIALKYKIW